VRPTSSEAKAHYEAEAALGLSYASIIHRRWYVALTLRRKAEASRELERLRLAREARWKAVAAGETAVPSLLWLDQLDTATRSGRRFRPTASGVVGGQRHGGELVALTPEPSVRLIDAAEDLGVTVGALRQWVNRGKVRRVFKVKGTGVVIPVAEVTRLKDELRRREREGVAA
jgi:hypothetical protein